MCDKKNYKNNNNKTRNCSCHSGRSNRFLVPSLLLLLAEKPSHGYELIDKYAELGFKESGSDPGAIYRTLSLLESEGFVKSKWETKEPGPARKIYSITPEGIELLSSWAVEIEKKKKTFEMFLNRFKKLKNF